MMARVMGEATRWHLQDVAYSQPQAKAWILKKQGVVEGVLASVDGLLVENVFSMTVRLPWMIE